MMSLKDVTSNIRSMERAFFEEEDSDIEHDLKLGLNKQNVSATEYND